MSRVINTDGPGKRRNQLMRTSAEMLRRLSQKSDIDDESKDMFALLIFCLREIEEGIDESALAWEKRDYWMKAEEFRQRWQWAGLMAGELEVLVMQNEWGRVPQFMVKLFPYFADVKITKFTRKEDAWQGYYQKLISERR
ncbi:MAG: hypothetical protein H7Y09_08690 [Chitinophagaceae bacterium]|nr:hypothetical protein [Anaerolineae bacterium]